MTSKVLSFVLIIVDIAICRRELTRVTVQTSGCSAALAQGQIPACRSTFGLSRAEETGGRNLLKTSQISKLSDQQTLRSAISQ
eukprot:162672-Hanusia_phi.AAC.1